VYFFFFRFIRKNPDDGDEVKILGDGGIILGEMDGLIDGDIDGEILGEMDGDIDGLILGDIDGLMDGDMLGLKEGDMLGDNEGLNDGEIDGLKEGDMLGDNDGLIEGDIDRLPKDGLIDLNDADRDDDDIIPDGNDGPMVLGEEIRIFTLEEGFTCVNLLYVSRFIFAMDVPRALKGVNSFPFTPTPLESMRTSCVVMKSPMSFILCGSGATPVFLKVIELAPFRSPCSLNLMVSTLLIFMGV